MREGLWNSQRILLTACGLLAVYWLAQLCLQPHAAPKQSDALLLQQRPTSSSDTAGNAVHQVVDPCRAGLATYAYVFTQYCLTGG